MTKMTKRNFYDALINFANGGEFAYATAEGDMKIDMDAIANFAAHEIELLDKKADKANAAAKTKNAATDELTEAVADVLSNEFQTIADVTAQIEGDQVTTSKVQYRLNALVKNGRAEKTEVVIPATSEHKARKVMAYRITA